MRNAIILFLSVLILSCTPPAADSLFVLTENGLEGV